MKQCSHALTIATAATCLAVACLAAAADATAPSTSPAWVPEVTAALEGELVARYGEEQRERAARGLRQVTSFWREEDGDRAALEELVRTNFAGDQVTLDAMFTRYERLLEQIDGHMAEITLELRRHCDLDAGPIMPFDQAFAGYEPAAHLTDDFFANGLAFTVLLNFPLTTLEQRLTEGAGWSRRQWAEARLADRFAKRIPAEVQLEVSRVGARAGQYIAEYNIWMHHLVDADGVRLFPAGQRLLSHWNLRDELKASYADPDHGLAKQRMIATVMERIVTQTIPEQVVDNPHVDWDPARNLVTLAAVSDAGAPPPAGLEPSNAPEPDTRYATVLANFRSERMVDRYSPTAPTALDRAFDEGREIPQRRVEAIFEAVLASPLLARVAGVIEARLGRPLEPFDIWYNGFRPSPSVTQEELDRAVARRYPDASAFERDIPRILTVLGFSEERARHLAGQIVVEPARGSGHAWGAAMRGAPSRLRTRVGANGMDYKGFNIAVHELGHNVEQTISLNDVDHYLLQGVPNTGFTEAVAFVFQVRDLDLLGLATPDLSRRALQALDDFWGAAEIAAVALVEIRVWQWMYDHPEATPTQLKQATLDIARGVWNAYYAPVIGHEDSVLLGVYSHMVARRLYLADYLLGQLIAVQVEEQLARAGAVGPEIDRMTRVGRVAPDLWMREAAGAPVGPEALLAATERALAELESGKPSSGG